MNSTNLLTAACLTSKTHPLSSACNRQQLFARSNYFNVDDQVARPMESQVLAALTSYFQPKTVFEIGTYSGFTTLHFAYNTPPETKIYTLDLPADHP